MKKDRLGVGGILILFFLVVLATGMSGCYAHCTGGSAIVTLEGTEVKATTKTSVYLVFTDQGVYQNSDSWWRLKFNSSDAHADIKKRQGEKVRIHYYGWRVPFLSMYPNIYKMEMLEGSKRAE